MFRSSAPFSLNGQREGAGTEGAGLPVRGFGDMRTKHEGVNFELKVVNVGA